jgi:hypothetical protein
MPGKCVVSFADKVGNYQKKMKRLEDSLKGNFDGDFLGFTSYDEIGSPRHSDVPYAFKPYAIQKARDLGYDLILWADSPVYAIKPIQPVFDHIFQNDYLLFDNIGYSLGDYSSDKQLDYFNITRQQAWDIPQVMACVMGFDFTEPVTQDFFKIYKDVARELYPGEWSNDDLTESKDARVRGSRHDQSVISCLAYVHGLRITNAQQTFFCYLEHKKVLQIAPSVCMYSAG